MATIIGTTKADYIHRRGDSSVDGFNRNEIDTATLGNDLIHAGDGDDFVFSDSGDDTIYGEAGDDQISAMAGKPVLYGGAGNDLLSIGEDVVRAQVFGEAGSDVMQYGSVDGSFGGVAASFAGGQGDDTFQAFGGFVADGPLLRFEGGSGSDALNFENFYGDTIVALNRFELSSVENLKFLGLTATREQLARFDSLNGSVLRLKDPGKFDLRDYSGTLDQLHGSNGADTIDMSGATALSVRVVEGGGGDDTIIGSDVVDLIDGGAGSDTLIGGAGNDIFLYESRSELLGDPTDVLQGGGGQDEAVFRYRDQGPSPIDISGMTFDGVESLVTEQSLKLAAEQLDGFDAVNGISSKSKVTKMFLTESGTVDLRGEIFEGIDVLVGNRGSDVVHLPNMSLLGTDPVAVLGRGGADTLTGGNGDDRLDGGGSADVLVGGLGDDTLVGGLAADSLTGGGGNDIFLFRTLADSTAKASDTLEDFVSASDRIDLKGIDAIAGTPADEAFGFIGAAAFSGQAGELRYAGGFLQGDVDGDGVADLRIELKAAQLKLGDLDL